MFIDIETIKATKTLFRDYDTEWNFIKAMDELSEIKYDNAVMVMGFSPWLIGENWIIVYEGENDNKIGVM